MPPAARHPQEPAVRSLIAPLSVLALCFAGMAALSLAMDRHHAQWSGRDAPPPGQRTALRLGGGLLLVWALWVSVAAWGAGVGAIAWCGWLTAGALSVAATLSYRPRCTARVAAACVLAAVLALLAA